MSFGQAVTAFFRNYAEFTGRARRSEFWWAMLFVALVSAGLGILSGGSLAGPFSFSPFASDESWLVGLWNLAVILPSLAVLVRRLRDAGHPWPFVFFGLIPVAGLILLAIFCATPSRARS